MKTAIGVLAEAPVSGRCKASLLAAHSAEWVTGLYAAMLRDTLDGLQAVPADEYLVFAAPVPAGPGEDTTDDARTQAALDVLARHVPSPWQLVAHDGGEIGLRTGAALATMFERGASYALLSGSDAPSFPTEPLIEALADPSTHAQILIGPREDGGYHLIGMARLEPRLLHEIPWGTPAVMETTRLRCREAGLGLRELPDGYDVDEPSDVLRLLDEMRSHPERAPRTAQFLTKNA